MDYKYQIKSHVLTAPAWIIQDPDKITADSPGDHYAPADTVVWLATEQWRLSSGHMGNCRSKRCSTRAVADEMVARWITERAEQAARAEAARNHTPQSWEAYRTHEELLELVRRATGPRTQLGAANSGHQNSGMHPVEAGVMWAVGILLVLFAVAKALGA